jgi:hypothetical protein
MIMIATECKPVCISRMRCTRFASQPYLRTSRIASKLKKKLFSFPFIQYTDLGLPIANYDYRLKILIFVVILQLEISKLKTCRFKL